MKRLRSALLVAILALSPLMARAAEQVNSFDVEIAVDKTGDILVTETINVTAEGNQVRRGIYRDLPRYFTKDGARLPNSYDVRGVTRDGNREPYAIEREGNAFRIRIGDADVFLDNGKHVFEIEYSVKNQIRYFDSYDELYWNVTGSYWNLPIAKAQAVIRLPSGARVIQTAGYTGRQGDTSRDYRYAQEGGAHIFTTTRPLQSNAGLTVALGFEKGAVDPPSAGDKRAEWWARNASAVTLATALMLLTAFYLTTFNRVGRDPVKPPVFARYQPPEGYSPAAVHFIYHRKVANHRALIATLLNFAIRKRITIDASNKNKTKLTWLAGATDGRGNPDQGEQLLAGIFNGRSNVTLGGEYDSAFTSAYERFRSQLAKDFGPPFFKWNTRFLILGIALTIIAVIISVNLSIGWTVWHSAAVGALVMLAAVFSYLLPAPTPKGQDIRTEIEGFRLYLEKAEKLQLDAVNPGSGEPPPMSIARYEQFLPYAVALGVEEPWTKYFEVTLPETSAHYRPGWTTMSSRSYRSLNGLNSALMSSMSSGVASSLPQSSSSSGSSGGGFSGGGGGGGGGGGW